LEVERDPVVTNLVMRITRDSCSKPKAAWALMRPDDQFQPMHVFIRERFADRLSYCLRLAVTPSVGEWSVIALPRPFYFLYYLIRPVRLTWKAFNRLTNHFFRKNKIYHGVTENTE
jgi:hypothetical protein